MPYPALLFLQSEDGYFAHYKTIYCQGTIKTFDGYEVRFRQSTFYHAFYDSENRDGNKDSFSSKRAQRMDWIKTALQDPSSDIRVGYDNTRKRNDPGRRVVIVQTSYVVIISIIDRTVKKAEFITAFPAEGDYMNKVIRNPKWK